MAEDEELDNNDIDLEAKETLDPYLTNSHNEELSPNEVMANVEE